MTIESVTGTTNIDSSDEYEILSAILAAIDKEQESAIDLRHRLHAMPELSHQEGETAAVIQEALEFAETYRAAGTGVIARIGPTGSPAVGLRAEMDALPVVEQTGVAYASTNGNMHACGHDVHMAALIAVCRAAHRIKDQLPVPLVALFQPSEEAVPSGAKMMVDQGIVQSENLAAVLALHVHPLLPSGSISVDAGPVNAAADNVEITVSGRAGHAAYPHRSRDPILALCAVIHGLQSAVSRRMDPMHNFVLTFGRISGGSTENVIPDTASTSGTVRVLQAENREFVQDLISECAERIAEAYGCHCRVVFDQGEPALVNDEMLVAGVRPMMGSVQLSIDSAMRSCGSDDFGYFSDAAPSLMMFLGVEGGGNGVQVPLHHPEFLPSAATVSRAARGLAAAYVGATQTILHNGR